MTRQLAAGTGIVLTLRRHAPFFLLALLSLALLLTNLGSDYLWEDEGDTAVLASNILQAGVPKAWDGRTFVDSDRGARVNEHLVMVTHPWAQYYLAAASLGLFGKTPFAARLPFALAAWVTLFLVYRLVQRLTTDRAAAFCATALMVFSVQFLLYGRQCRNYALNMLLTCWLISIFLEMKSARQSILFGLAAVLLFHSHPIGVVPIGVLGILTLIYPPFDPQRKWYWCAFPAIVALTAPWYALAHRGYAEIVDPLKSAPQLAARFLQYMVECGSVTPMIGTIVLMVLWLVRARALRNRPETGLFLIISAIVFAYALPMVATQSAEGIWRIGIRYCPAIIPLMAMGAGISMVQVGGGRKLVWIPLLLLFSFTQLAQMTPWWLVLPNLIQIGNETVETHPPAEMIDYFFARGELLFVTGLRQENRGTTAMACGFLSEHAQPQDKLITNYDWEPLYFHTALPQALKILPDYPVYEIARRNRLPPYVFGVGNARWVIWHPIWNGYQGYFWSSLQDQIRQEGGELTQVAELKETVWENRENIHFHRFAGDKYLFGGPIGISNAVIFQVAWPSPPRS